MAEWWEIAIPVAGTLLGAAVGAGSQVLIRGRQERHETRMRLFEKRLDVYAELLNLIEKICDQCGEDGREGLYMRHHAAMSAINSRLVLMAARPIGLAARDFFDAVRDNDKADMDTARLQLVKLVREELGNP